MGKSYNLTNLTLYTAAAVNQVPARLFGGQEAHVLGMYILRSRFIFSKLIKVIASYMRVFFSWESYAYTTFKLNFLQADQGYS